MANLDERLREELRRSLRPADPVELFDDLSRRRGRRRVARKVGGGALVVAVLAATVGGFLFLNDVFRGEQVVTTPHEPRIVIGRSELKLFEGGGSSSSRWEVWSIMPDGSDLAPVFVGDEPAMEPTASPDGSSIAFLLRDPGSVAGAELRLMMRDGESRVTEVADGIALMLRHGLVSWSPDGSEIAVLDTRGKGTVAFDQFGLPFGDIRIIDVSTGTSRWIDVKGQGQSLAWSRNGQIAVTLMSADDAIGDLTIIDNGGAALARIATDATSPAWSPDGSRLAYLASNKEGWDVMTSSADGSTTSRATHDGGFKESVTWSGDGDRLIFTEADTDDCYLRSVSPDGGTVTTLGDRASLGGCPRSVSWQAVTSVTTPSPTPTDEAGRDIGLPFRLCDVSTLDRIRLSDAGAGRVWVGSKVTDEGTCPEPLIPDHVVAADVDLDGAADTWIDMRCRGGCQPSPEAASDLNADGLDEVFVLQDLFSIASYHVVTMVDGELVAATVAPPGHPEADLDPGGVAVLSVGGDEGYASWLRCEGYPDAPTIVSTWTWHPVEGPGSEVSEVHETRMRLGSDGTFAVLDTADSTHPVGTPIPGVTDAPTCGVDLTLGL